MQRQDFPRFPKANPKAVVAGKLYRFTVLTEGLIRYEYANDGVFEDRASTFAINRDLPVPRFQLVDEEDRLEIITDKYHLKYDKKPFSASGFSVQVKGNVTDWKSNWRYGGGIKQEDYQLYGTARTLDEANGRIPLEPGVVNRNGYANIDDSESFLFTDEGWVIGRQGSRVDGYLFAYGLDFKGAIKALYAVSGPQPLLPRWSLGNWWSRYYEYTAKSYLDLMDRFRQEGLPFSVGVIDMDWHLVREEVVKKAGFSGWTGYTWNKNLFPNPEQFVSELHERGLKTCLNDHPADGVAPYEEKYADMARALGRDPSTSHPISFDIARKEYANAYFDVVLKALEDDGVDFWWVDWQQGPYSTEPGVDPLWVLNHYHFLNNKHGNTRPLTFSRFAGPGSHRYPVGFSGDSVVTWASLDFQPEFTATASNIGYGWWSHDIGGHMQGYRDDELATRWVQLGVFSPILRLHSTSNVWNSKEPWRFIPEAQKAQNEALRLRHQLMPYLYSMNVRAAQDAEPIVQPIYWEYPENPDAYQNKNTYMFGSELFVAPVTSPRDGVTRRSKTTCWLPPGRYVDIHSGLVYDGDRQVEFHRALSSYAVLAKEGSIIPLDANPEPQNGCPNPEALEIRVVVGADASFILREDDGSGSVLESVNLINTPVRWSQETATLTIGPASGTDPSIPSKRDWSITFISLSTSDSSNLAASIDGQQQVVYEHQPCILHAVPTTSKVEIHLGCKNPQLRINEPLKEAYGIIDEAQSAFDDKNRIWEILQPERPMATKIGSLMALQGPPESLKAALMEILLADSRVK